MTLEELDARISAIDECYDILIKLYINSDCDTSEELFEVLRDRYKELRDSAWNEFAQKIDELSKQAWNGLVYRGRPPGTEDDRPERK